MDAPPVPSRIVILLVVPRRFQRNCLPSCYSSLHSPGLGLGFGEFLCSFASRRFSWGWAMLAEVGYTEEADVGLLNQSEVS
jgi:hypothetical protein